VNCRILDPCNVPGEDMKRFFFTELVVFLSS
jgi:hypothetical protein